MEEDDIGTTEGVYIQVPYLLYNEYIQGCISGSRRKEFIKLCKGALSGELRITQIDSEIRNRSISNRGIDLLPDFVRYGVEGGTHDFEAIKLQILEDYFESEDFEQECDNTEIDELGYGNVDIPEDAGKDFVVNYLRDEFSQYVLDEQDELREKCEGIIMQIFKDINMEV